MSVRRLGQYEVLGEVGRGGMAVVHRGFDPALERTVAIKVLHPHLSHEPESRQRFHREARAVAQLRHPNIIEIFAYSGLDSAETFIVTEFVDGPDLKRFVAQHPVQLPQVAALLALPIAGALAHAHSHGIVHRDIKPENILLQKGGVPKLTDFGIAHLIDDHMTVTGAILGSPAYMSPEHVEGRAVDGRSDVFSLGTLLYTLAAGRLPFRSETAHGLLRQVLDSDAPDPRRFNPLIDDHLYAIIRRAMQRRPEERYPTVDKMARDLRIYLEAEGLTEPDDALRAFLSAPESYQEALARALSDRIRGRARASVARGRLTEGLELYNRLLHLDGEDAAALAEVRRLTRRFRLRRNTVRSLAMLVALAILVGAGLWAAQVIRGWASDGPPSGPTGPLGPVATVVGADVGRPGPPGPPGLDITAPAPTEARPRELVGRRERVRAPVDFAEITPRRTRLPLETRLTTPPRPPVRPPRPVVRRGPDVRAPAEPVEPVPALIPVVVKADPPAVQISVNGVYRGSGKVALQLPPGTHQVLLRHPVCAHCEDTQRSFTLDPKNPPRDALAYRIRYRPARITVLAPVTAKVWVGRVSGWTAQEITVPMGDHDERSVDVRVLADGYVPWTRRVTLGAGANLRLSAELTPRE
jgi:serine/threonine-protein kinase